MKSKFLLPVRFKKIGWILLIFGVLFGILDMLPNYAGIFLFLPSNIPNEILGISIIVGGIAVAFSREFDEDEFISKIRLDCLVWAIYWNYGMLLLAFIFVYDLDFFWVMVFNMFTPLLLFILRFNWLLRISRKASKE